MVILGGMVMLLMVMMVVVVILMVMMVMVIVTTDLSRPHSLVLRVSGHTASGSYKCEVSVEKSFYTLSSSKNLTVVGRCRLLNLWLSLKK